MILLQILSHGDSVLNDKLDKLASHLTDIEKKVSTTPWLTLGSVFLGGALVWVGQAIDRVAKNRRENRQQISEVFTCCENKWLFIRNLIKEIATHKNMRAFWWYSYLDEQNADNRDVELEKKYYENLLLESDAAIKCSLKVGEELAEYYSLVSKLKMLTNGSFDVSFIPTLASKLDFEDADEINIGLNNEQALEIADKNKKELIVEYFSKFVPIDTLQTSLRELTKKILNNGNSKKGGEKKGRSKEEGRAKKGSSWQPSAATTR